MAAAMIGPDGQLRWTTDQACAQLGVSRKDLRNWVYRSKREPGFPRVDPPIHDGVDWWYLADQLIEVEKRTAFSPRGRKRAA